jgi:hypothetical protein
MRGVFLTMAFVLCTLSALIDASTWMVGQTITSGNSIVSGDSSHFAIVQSDGNFCVYSGSGPTTNTGYVWCNSNNPPGNCNTITASLSTTGVFTVTSNAITTLFTCTHSSGTISTNYIAQISNTGKFQLALSGVTVNCN